MRKTTLVFLIAILATHSMTSQETVIQLKWFHQFQFAGYYMAEKKGFYDEAGIDVTIREGGPSVDVAHEVSTGSAHFGVLGSELLLHRADSKDFVVLAPIMQHSIRAVFAREADGVYSLNDLVGKRLMLNTNELPEFRAMFEKEGIPFESLRIEPKSSDANKLFMEGQIDGLNGSLANQPYAFEAAGIDYVSFRPLTYGIDFYGDTLFTTESLAYKDTERVNDFLKATLRGWEYAFDHPEETIGVIIVDYRSLKSRDLLYFEFMKLKDLIAPQLVQIGHNNPDRWKHIESTYRDLGMIEGELQLDGFFFNPRYKTERMNKMVARSIMALLVLFFLFLIISFSFNRRLKRIVSLKTAQLASVIESMPVLIIGLDCLWRITLWNQRAELITGIKEIDAMGKSVFETIPYLKRIKPQIEQSLHSGTIYRDTKHRFLESNRFTYRDISLFPLAKDKKNCAVLKIEDVTEQVELTESLVQNEKLISLGRMAAGLAHEVNNPLAGIIQSSSVMANRLFNKIESPANRDSAEEAGLSTSALARYLEMRDIPRLFRNIEESTRRITKIIDDFLSYSRRESEKPEIFSLPDLIESTLELASIEYNLKNNYDFSKIEIQREYEYNLPGIKSYRSKLRQVLLNILRNGAQEMHLAGTIDPKFKIIVKRKSHSRFIITITDNGPGITDEIIEKIFDPFFTTKELGTGTGLGLSMSYYLIHEYMKGELSVESEPGKGASFTIDLPETQISEPEYFI